MALTTIYFSARNITVLKGAMNRGTKRLGVSQKAQEPMPDGAVLNGVIVDEEALFQAFSNLKGRFGPMGDAVLALDTNHIAYKIAVLPKVSDKQTARLVRNEFLDRNLTDKEYIYDYSVLKAGWLPKQQRLVMCCAVDKSIIDAYKAFFKRVGVKLKRIDFAANALLQALASNVNLFQRKATLVCVVDHYFVTILSFLSNGEIGLQRARILSSETDEGYLSEISNVIYSYVQGRKSLKRGEKIEDIYIFDSNAYMPEEYTGMALGLDFQNIWVGVKSVLTTNDITEQDADGYVFNLAALSSLASKDLNLATYKVAKPLPVRQIAFAFAMLLLAGLVGGSAWFLKTIYDETDSLRREIAVVNASIENAQKKSASTELVAEVASLNTLLGKFNEYKTLLASTPALTSNVVLSTINLMAAEVQLGTLVFESEEGSLTFDCQLQNPDRVAFYVDRLRSSGLFSDIVYWGYEGSGGEDGSYGFIIVCIIKEVRSVG